MHVHKHIGTHAHTVYTHRHVHAQLYILMHYYPWIILTELARACMRVYVYARMHTHVHTLAEHMLCVMCYVLLCALIVQKMPGI